MKCTRVLTGAILLAFAIGCARRKAVAPVTSVPTQEPTHTVIIGENALRKLALQPLEIIWPQVLDGPTTGQTSYRVVLDPLGNVSEVLPLSMFVERANDSAQRQIMRWKFKPFVRDGAAVQAEAVLTFHFDTRAYGPAAPLTEAEVRKLASGIVNADYPRGTATGTTCSLRIAVDSDGYLIEVIDNKCPRELSIPCLDAIRKWHFSPIIENGQPRPYRAEVTFRAP